MHKSRKRKKGRFRSFDLVLYQSIGRLNTKPISMRRSTLNSINLRRYGTYPLSAISFIIQTLIFRVTDHSSKDLLSKILPTYILGSRINIVRSDPAAGAPPRLLATGEAKPILFTKDESGCTEERKPSHDIMREGEEVLRPKISNPSPKSFLPNLTELP